MIILVIGKPDSGKSLIAEDIVCSLSDKKRYYLATMLIYDKAGIERIKKHRSQREGKNFVTIEVPYRIDRALDMIDEPDNSAVLLECIANLVGNEMYENPDRIKLCKPNPDLMTGFTDEIFKDIEKLAGNVKDLVIVTNKYTKDENCDEMTRLYIDLIDMLNEKLMKLADRIVDVGNEDT